MNVRCKCGVKPRQVGPKWVRLYSSARTSRLKCLACKRTWTTSAKYGNKLHVYREYSRKGMTHEHVLHRLFIDRDLRIDPVTSVVESCRKSSFNRDGQWLAMKQVPDSHDSGYRFVEVSFNNMKRKVGVHVLQWMQANGWVLRGAEGTMAYNTGIPHGHDVHHRLPQPPRPQMKDNALAMITVIPSHLNQSHQTENYDNDGF